MQLNKTKLAGIISLLCCSSAMSTTLSVVEEQTNKNRFGPFATAMDTSSVGTATATITQTFAQPFWYDLGAPWTYDDYCTLNANLCVTLWEGTKDDNSNGILKWRGNVSNTFAVAGNYLSESKASSAVGSNPNPAGAGQVSARITALSGSDFIGYETIGSETTENNFARRAFYNAEILPAKDFTDGSGNKDLNGFTSAYDFADVKIGSYKKRVIVGQTSVSWANLLSSDATNLARFSECYNAALADDRADYDDLYYCPGFNLQAAFWEKDVETPLPVATEPSIMTTKWLSAANNFSNAGNEESATYIASAYAINTSGYAVGFSTENINSSDSGGHNWSVLFTPSVTDAVLTYTPEELTIVGTGFDYKDDFLNTVAVDITDFVLEDNKFIEASSSKAENKTAFIALGNRKHNKSQNGNYAIEFYTYNIADKSISFPLQNKPINGSNSQATKINNSGIVVGWRDDHGETTPSINGSPRFQAAFVYDYKTNKTAYLNDIYCKTLASDSDVKYRITNAISVSDNDAAGNFTVLANGVDYGNLTNYQNIKNGIPVVLSMKLNESDIVADSGSQQCPVLDNGNYKRKGAGMNQFILFPMFLLFFRRFKR